MSEINELFFGGSTSTMTADQLQAHREAGTVLHSQTMSRLSRGTSSGRLIFTDIEEVTRSQLNLTVAKLEKDGWHCAGALHAEKATVGPRDGTGGE